MYKNKRIPNSNRINTNPNSNNSNTRNNTSITNNTEEPSIISLSPVNNNKNMASSNVVEKFAELDKDSGTKLTLEMYKEANSYVAKLNIPELEYYEYRTFKVGSQELTMVVPIKDYEHNEQYKKKMENKRKSIEKSRDTFAKYSSASVVSHME